MNKSDLSASDWALLSELRKEGIMDRELLINALTRCKNTKYKRDANPMYVARTVDNFISSLEGISLQEGREKLACEMQNIELCQNAGSIIITVGGICGIGKSNAGAKLTATRGL